MTYSAPTFTPAVGIVGKKTIVQLSGTPDSTNSPPTVYMYVQSAPPNSKIKTLDQLAVLADYNAGKYTGLYPGPLDKGVDRSALRLEPSPAGATFTPDVAGLYTLRAYDVQQYRFVPHYGGHVPGLTELAETDNELAALPAYAGGTAQAASATAPYYVKEAHTRLVGQYTPHSATLSVSGYADTLDVLDYNRVTLTAPSSPLAKLALLDADVQAALLSIRSVTTGTVAQLTLDSPGEFAWLFAAFNAHIAFVGAFSVHTVADVVNACSPTVCTDLATAIAVLNSIRTKYAAHRVLLGTVHQVADAVNVTTAPVATDFPTCVALWTDLRDRLWPHMASQVFHYGSKDGTAYEWHEAPLPGSIAHLVAQTNWLATLYNAHIRRINQETHQSADANNGMSAISYTSTDGLASSLNLLADAVTHHMANQKADGSAAGLPYHLDPVSGLAITTNAKIPVRAVGSDPGSIQQVAEWVVYTLEQHAMDTLAHRGDAQWGRSIAPTFVTDSLVARLQRAWLAATQTIAHTLPEFQSPISGLVQKGWT